MTRTELDSLTVYASNDGAGVELWNSSGFVASFPDRDAAYAEVLRLRGAKQREPIDTAELRAALAAGADFAAGSEILAARVLAAAAHI